MNEVVEELVKWTDANKMKLNGKKNERNRPWSAAERSTPPPQLVVDNHAVERVTSFKLLGIHISSNMKWDAHIGFICAKAASRLHFLKVTKRTCSNTGDLVCFYTTVIRPVFGICVSCVAFQSHEEAHSWNPNRF